MVAADPDKQAPATPEQEPQRNALGQFKPGVSGNPRGRPKAKAVLSDCLRKELAEVLPSGLTAAEDIAATVVRLARGGERWACELCWDRIEGKPAVEHTLPDGVPHTLVEYRLHKEDDAAGEEEGP